MEGMLLCMRIVREGGHLCRKQAMHPSGWLAEAAQSLDLLRTTAQCLGQPELGVIWH